MFTWIKKKAKKLLLLNIERNTKNKGKNSWNKTNAQCRKSTMLMALKKWENWSTP